MGLPFVASGLDGKPGKAGSYGRVARSRAIPHDTRRIEFRKMAGAERVCAKFIGEKPAGYQPAARCSQNSSQRPLSWEQRRAIIALAWLTVQRIPDCFSRCPMIVLHPKCCRQHFGCNAGNIVTRSCAAE